MVVLLTNFVAMLTIHSSLVPSQHTPLSQWSEQTAEHSHFTLLDLSHMAFTPVAASAHAPPRELLLARNAYKQAKYTQCKTQTALNERGRGYNCPHSWFNTIFWEQSRKTHLCMRALFIQVSDNRQIFRSLQRYHTFLVNMFSSVLDVNFTRRLTPLL